MPDKCTLCNLHKISNANLIPGVGPQPAKILLIGEGPGEAEEAQGQPFVGPAGQMLDQLLMQAGINRAECRISNVVRCRPTNADEKWKDKRGHIHYGNRAPFPSEVYVCAPTYLEAEIAATKPNVIVPVGKVAYNYISGEFSVKSYSKNEDGTFAPELEKKPGRMPNITSERGVERWSERYQAKCIPIIHPSALLRNASQINVTIEDLKRIKKASETKEPTPKIPVEYKLIDTWDEVLWALERLKAVPKFSWDLETTGFDYFREKIICWGFSWKEGTGVSIRWIDNEGKPLYTEQQRAVFIDELEDLFLDYSKEIWGFNIKFDAHHAMTSNLPYPVNARDAMLAHHLLDSETPHDLKTLAHIFCVDPETMCLTKHNGWVTYDRIDANDEILSYDAVSGKTKWEKPVRIHVVSSYEGKMISIGNRQLDALVTPNHRWPIEYRCGGKARKGRKISLKRTHELTKEGSILRSALHEAPKKQKFSNAFVELAAWYFTEGCSYSDGKYVVISQSLSVNKKNVERIQKTIVRCGGKRSPKGVYRGGSKRRSGLFYNRMGPAEDGAINFGLSGNFLDRLVSCVGGHRKVPTMDFITSLTDTQLQLFINVCMEGDGFPRRQLFYQWDRARMDAFFTVATLAGWSPSLGNRGDECALRRKAGRGNARSYLARNPMRAVDYKGVVWCPVTPSSYWVARRRDKIFITGNTDMGGYEEELLKTTGTGAKEKRDFLSIPWQVLGFYNCGDVDCTFRLSNILPERMKKYPKMVTFFNTWIPKFLRSVTMMERNGVPLDFEMVHDIHTRMGARCVEIEKEFKRQLAESGFKFKVKLKNKELTIDDLNLKSPKQLPDIFFRHFKMKPIEGKIGKTGPSLDKEVLDKLAKIHSDNTLLMLLVEYRSLQTNMNTALEGLKNSALFGRVDVDPEIKDFIWTPEEARNKGYWTDGRVRCDYLLHGTSTGRTASRGPNLQNLKRATKEDIDRGFAIRGCLQALPGWKFVAADLSGAELWTLQGLSKDNEMQKALMSPEGIHYRYASMIYQIPWDKVDKEQKAQAKRIVFRIIYGGTAFSLAEELEIPLPQAEQYTNLFFQAFPAAKYYFDTVEMFVQTHLYAESAFGRIRHFPAAASNHRPTVSEAMREAKNFMVQSCASDITQMAAYRILEEAESKGMRFRQALNVHDDNTFHVPVNELEQASEIIKRHMEAFVPELGISTKVDLEISDRWKIADDEVEIEESEAVEA